MNGTLTLLIPSWRVRSLLTWLSHRTYLQLLPLAALGARVLFTGSAPMWVRTLAAVATVLLVLVTSAGVRLHDELDDAGIPCTWCGLEAGTDDDQEDGR
ncbi:MULTISPECIES: hypothetical protein [Streptomyces]|uniref:Uncharacterized protein n=1 Tax=Streptomyces flavochromogenes TaxID=68199 RepID=A0ABW6Y3T3_9ACTN